MGNGGDDRLMGKGSRTRKRNAAINRRKNGTFGAWKGGGSNYTHAGLMIHIGKEFKRQKKRKSKVGDIVRKKKQNGQFHKGALWYVKTDHGWRKSPTEKQRPTAGQITKINKASRPGRVSVKRARRV